jgi:voltage-gated potassium channel
MSDLRAHALTAMLSPGVEMDKPQETVAESRIKRLRSVLRLLYHGHSPEAERFQRVVLLVDLAIIAFFIVGPLFKDRPSYLWIDVAVATILFCDIAARGLAATDIRRWLRQLTTIIDIFILVTLLFPAWLANVGFLRVLRLWTLSRSGFLWRPLKKRGLSAWEDTGRAIVNLVTFLFVVAGFIFSFFAGEATGIEGYIDALYYTVTAVTTTGFGDIVLPGTWGKIVAILVMIIGISLFVRLAQAIFRPHKVNFPCPQCGLRRHDPDAVHCKACGHLLNIPDEGQT